MPRCDTAADLPLDRGLNSLVCAQRTPTPAGGTKLSQVNTLLKAYWDRTLLSASSTKTKKQPGAHEGMADISLGQKHCFVIICSCHPVTPKGGKGTVDGKTGGKQSEKTVRSICRSLQGRQCIHMCGQGHTRGRKGWGLRQWNHTHRQKQLQLRVATLPGTNLTATGSSSGLRSNWQHKWKLTGYENPQAPKLKCQKGAAGAKEARRDRPCKEASGDLSACPAPSSPGRRDQRLAAVTETQGGTCEADDPCSQRSKYSWVAESTAQRCSFLLHEPRVFKIWEMTVWLKSNKGLENKTDISAVCQSRYLVCQYLVGGHSRGPSSGVSGWAGSQECQGTSFLLPEEEEEEGASVALLQFIASQCSVGRCCRRWTDEGCCSYYSTAPDSERKKKAQVCGRESSTQTLAIKWSPTGQVRKDSYFWNPVQRKTSNIHDGSWTSQRTE